MEREREKRRDTYAHMHRLDHRGPVPLKKGEKKKERKKRTKQNKVRLQWQCAPAELLTCLCAAQSHPSTSAAGDLQAQTIWEGLVHLCMGVSTAPCTTPAPLPTARHNLETFWAVSYIRIEFFFFQQKCPCERAVGENLTEGTRGFPPRNCPPALPEKREGKRKWCLTKQQKTSLLNSCHQTSINILVIVSILS